MPYPRSLTNYLNRVSNVSKNTIKLTPYRTNNVKNGDILVLDLPANAMVHLDSLCLSFKASTSTSAGYATFPRHIESLISKLNWELNGVSIASCNHLSDLYNIMYNLSMGSDLENKRKLYQNAVEQSANPTSNVTSQPFQVHNWLGFGGSVQGRVLDLGILGSCRLHITLEGTNVLVKDAASTGESYTLDDIFFTIDSISVDDGVLYPAKANYLQSGGIIEMPFDTYFSSLFGCSSYTQSSRFSVSTQSLDYILACFPKNRTISQFSSNNHTSAYFEYPSHDASDRTNNTLVDWSFSVNNVQVPQFKVPKDHTFALLQNVMGISQSVDGGICSSISDSQTWNDGYWVAGVRLDLLTDEDERMISGLSTSGTNASIEFNSSGIGSFNPGNVLLFVKTTSTLRVGAGRSLEIVQ